MAAFALLAMWALSLVSGWGPDFDDISPETGLLSLALVIGTLRAAGLDNPARVQIYQHLLILPGDHFRSIARTLGTGMGETRRHLDILRRNGIVREEKKDGKCRYYPCSGGSNEGRNELFEKYWNYHDLRYQTFLFVRTQGAASPSTVASALGISRQRAEYHLMQLLDLGRLRHENGCYRV